MSVPFECTCCVASSKKHVDRKVRTCTLEKTFPMIYSKVKLSYIVYVDETPLVAFACVKQQCYFLHFIYIVQKDKNDVAVRTVNYGGSVFSLANRA
jgi:hypothetical protein